MKSSFEAAFPNITGWFKESGTVEIGYDPARTASSERWTKAGCRGAGRAITSRSTMPLSTWRTASKRQPAPVCVLPRERSSQSHRQRQRPDRRKSRLPKDPLSGQIQKLEEIIEAIRRKENVQVTRLTVVKKLCENPDAAEAFALFLARKGQERLREKKGKERYLELASRAVREMKSYVDDPTEDRKEGLWSLLMDIEAEQNEYESVRWGAVRKIKCWDLLIVEKSLRTILNRLEARYWLYRASRDYVGGNIYFEKGAIPQIEEIAQFWRRYYRGKA